MTDITNGHTGLGAANADRAFFGHPRGLSVLFFSEMWERFSYYGLRALLILYMTADVATGGLGYDVATAGIIYGTYTSMVYLMAVPGGWLADRVFGQKIGLFHVFQLGLAEPGFAAVEDRYFEFELGLPGHDMFLVAALEFTFLFEAAEKFQIGDVARGIREAVAPRRSLQLEFPHL